jgi:glycosyltransferase involved in cell wall biosynthesis
MKAEPIFWSIIVPVYNETKRVHNLDKILRYLGKLEEPWEIIVVNDGSRDDTYQKLKLFKRRSNFKLISYATNRGKGFAVKTGILAASGKFRLFCDIDLSTPIEEMPKFRTHFAAADVVIGSRKLKGAKVMLHQSFLRECLGSGFTLLSQLVLNTWVSDFTCGFKCFSKRASEKIFNKTRIFRWGFDSEVLFLAKKYGLKTAEVPVIWKNDPQTRVRFPRDLINSFAELILIRYYDWVRGLY